jgi:tetratricopeptide (TPR) repeat protein
MKMKENKYWYDAILFIAAMTLYAPSLWYGFVGDDLIYFIGNPHITSFDLWTILRSGAIGADYVPLRDLSFVLDYLLWGENPFGFHLTNVIIFGITVVAIRYLFLRLNALLISVKDETADAPAFLAALLFTLHPTHREVVCAVYNRGALMTALFCVLACIYFIKYLRDDNNSSRSYVVALSFSLCAFMSREYGIILPLLLLLLVAFDARSKQAAPLMSTAPFFILAAFFFFIYKQYAISAKYIIPSTEAFLPETLSKLTVAVKIVVFYLIRLVTFQGDFYQAGSIVFALASTCIITGLLVAALKIRRRNPQLLAGLLFYLICLIPALNFYKTDPVVAARYAYLPYVGLFFTFTSVPFHGIKKAIPVAAIVFTILWSLSTADQLGMYKNNIAYWENCTQVKTSAPVLRELAMAYYSDRQYEKAVQTFRKVQPVPVDANYHAMVGYACFHQGDYRCAVQSLEKAVSLGTNDFKVILTLASARMTIANPRERGKYLDEIGRSLPQMKQTGK